jgi:hypothetical protein
MSKMRTLAITLWFPEKCLSCFFILRNNLLVKQFQHSICINSIITKTNTEISFSFWYLYRNLFLFLINTLLLYIPLLALTDRQNYRRRLKYTCWAWAGGIFFTVLLLCQFLVLAGNRFWFYILMFLEYTTVVVLC